MKLEAFEDFETKPCQYCGTLTVCLLMFQGHKVFVCKPCVDRKMLETVTKASRPKVTTGRKDGSGNREE